MKILSDIYPKLFNLTPPDLLAAMRVFPSRDDDEKMSWQRKSDWEQTAAELSRICRSLVLEARGLDLGELQEVENNYAVLQHDLRKACKGALHCGTGLHSGIEPEHVFPINLEWAERGNAIKVRLDKFNKAFKKQYGKHFRTPDYLNGYVDFDVLTELTKDARATMAAVLAPHADEDGEIEHADPVSEVPVALRGIFGEVP